MKKIVALLLIIAATLSACQKQTCYTCPHGNNGYVITVCADSWGLAPGGGFQTPPGQAFANYTNCY
jgi:hypothetical protein